MELSKKITFDSSKTITLQDLTAKPRIRIDKVIFNTTEKNWLNHIGQAIISVTIARYGKDGKKRSFKKGSLSFNQLIKEFHDRPDFEINREFGFNNSPGIDQVEEDEFWRVTIELKNLMFKPNERLDILLSDVQLIHK